MIQYVDGAKGSKDATEVWSRIEPSGIIVKCYKCNEWKGIINNNKVECKCIKEK